MSVLVTSLTNKDLRRDGRRTSVPWVSSDTSTDVACDHEILARTSSDAYRRFATTLRFLLSVLEDDFELEATRSPSPILCRV